MKKTIFITIGVVLLTSVVFLVLQMLNSTPNATPNTQTSGAVTQPFPTDSTNIPSASGGGLEVGGSGKPSLTVAAQNPTGTMVVQDFRANSDTVRDPINTSFYYLKYHTTGEGATQNPPYTISYDMVTGSFTVALYQEPLRQTRAEAEQYLMSALGLSQANMCALRYTVSVPGDINEYYSGTNLLFSFCPGATVLP
jgi:hypothetical protein